MKVWMEIYNLEGKATIWWQDLKISQGLKEKNLERKNSKDYLKNSTYLRITTKEKPRNSMR